MNERPPVPVPERDTMIRKKPRSIITVFALLFVTAFPAGLSAGPETDNAAYTIKFGTMAPSQSAWTDLPVKLLIPIVHDMFGNKIRLVVYYGGTMGDDSDIIRKIKLGQLHACCCTNQGTVKAVPELSVLTLPLLFRSYGEVDYVLAKLRGPIESLFEDRGFYLLFIVDTGFLYFFSKNDCSTLAAIQEHRVFSWFGEIQLETFKQLDIHPIPVAIPELPSSISSGVTDAGTGPASWLLATQMYSHVHYALDLPLFYGPSTGFISKKEVDKFIQDIEKHPETFIALQKHFSSFIRNLKPESYLDNLGVKEKTYREAGMDVLSWLQRQELGVPADVSALMFGIFRKAEKAWLSSIRNFEKECFQGFAKRGMKRVPLASEDHARFQKSAQTVWEKYSGTIFPEWLLQDILAALEEYRAQPGTGIRK